MPERKYQDVGQLIKGQRVQVGISQPELAEATGMDPSTITRIEAGERRPRPDKCRRLAQALGMDPNDLLLSFGWAPDYKVDADRAINEELRLLLWDIGRTVMTEAGLASIAREQRAEFLAELKNWRARLHRDAPS